MYYKALLSKIKVTGAVLALLFAGCNGKEEAKVALKSITVSPADPVSLAIGDTHRLSTTPEPADAVDVNIKWTSSDETVASVSEQGLVTANAIGAVAVKASNGDISSAPVAVTVTLKALTSFTVTPAALEDLYVGDDDVQLAITKTPADAGGSFTYASGNLDVVTVSDAGLVHVVGAGATAITVASGSITQTVPVKVTPHEQTAKTYNDTIIRMTLKDADCPFADHADYGIYIPTRTEALRGVLILQHGCGMEQFGITRSYDLQYQALAKKRKLAVIETALYGSCFVWRSPGAGTVAALLKVLNDTGEKTGRPELSAVPWLLFGHSGGGYWTLAMLKEYPERIMAAVCYSPAFDPQWDYPAAAAKVPLLTRHAGAKDLNTDGVSCWATSVRAFQKLRNMDAPVSIAHNPTQNHNLSYIRYMAIPFYEAVMKQRMPESDGTVMRDLDRTQTWLGDTLTLQLYKESTYAGDKKGLCVLPDEATARLWKEYVSTGTVTDKTPPPAPFNVKAKRNGGNIEVSWEADADIESGILRFEIFKDGAQVGNLPKTGAYQRFDTNGDNTVPVETPEMKFEIAGGMDNAGHTIAVRTVNHFNLPSEKTEVQLKQE
ncbi:MAG: Ig-like domain-containing protein [Tannerella sp.]|jgi:pimeloyl-ACP methyl ester carboxylesterase|nr:Ig-like domain-containing protein [Tannerella sp.]